MPSTQAMDDFDDFEVVFGKSSNIAYEKSAAGDIKQRRGSLDNDLFIDRLLKALGIQTGMFYIRNALNSHVIHAYDLSLQLQICIQLNPTETFDFFTKRSSVALLLITISTQRYIIFSKTSRNTAISLPEILPVHHTCQESTEHSSMEYGNSTDSSLR